ncbi:MAG: hypothetical protein VW339_12005 [Quisquiliibacterium sp.]
MNQIQQFLEMTLEPSQADQAVQRIREKREKERKVRLYWEKIQGSKSRPEPRREE